MIGLVAAIALATGPSFGSATRTVGHWSRSGAVRIRERVQQWREQRARQAARPRTTVQRAVATAPVAPERKKSVALPVNEAAAEPRVATAPPKPAIANRAAPVAAKRTIVPEAKSPQQTSLPMPSGSRGYSLPPIELLNDPEPQEIESETELLERARHITEKLREFSGRRMRWSRSTPAPWSRPSSSSPTPA